MEDRIPRGLQHHYKTCCEKGGHRGRRACMVQRWHHCGDVVFRTGGLVYDINMLGKLIEKVISKRLRFQALFNNTIHSC